MNILIYFPYNQRTVEQQSVMEMFVKNKHQVFLLTLSPVNTLHNIAIQLSVQAYASPVGEIKGTSSIINNARYLAKFIKQHRIDVVFAHQQLCAMPMILANVFVKCNWYYIRHNTDEGYTETGIKTKILNKLINRFSKKIIAPSNIVYQFLNKVEKVPERKLIRINYGYNFNQYEKPNETAIATIKNTYPSSLLIVSIARMVAAKRHLLMFDIIKTLKLKGLVCKFICLGDGPLLNDYMQWINNNDMQDYIYLLGRKTNVMDYLAAGDVLLHLSETEASNSVVKEAALAKMAAIVCKGVGDFEDYIQDNQNGFLMDKKSPVEATAALLLDLYSNKNKLIAAGTQAQSTIIDTFDIKNIESDYKALLDLV